MPRNFNKAILQMIQSSGTTTPGELEAFYQESKWGIRLQEAETTLWKGPGGTLITAHQAEPAEEPKTELETLRKRQIEADEMPLEGWELPEEVNHHQDGHAARAYQEGPSAEVNSGKKGGRNGA